MASLAYENGKKLLCGDYTSYTPSGKSLFSKKNRVSNTPCSGDVIYFYTSSLGRVSHVGIVENVELIDSKAMKYRIVTIEGNTSAGTIFSRDGGEVARKTYTFNSSEVGGKNRINCFCHPLFSEELCTKDEFLQAARNWIGYVEKESNGTDVQLKNKTWNPGDENYTWFGKWYGLNPAQWCQMFVCYCAYEACLNHKVDQRTGWFKEDDKWFYYKQGEKLKDQWLEVSDRWYVLSGDGHALTDEWLQSSGSWYYFGPTSAMLTSLWYKYKEDWYYFSSTGEMITDAYTYDVESGKFCFFGEDGKWDGKYVSWEEIEGNADIVK